MAEGPGVGVQSYFNLKGYQSYSLRTKISSLKLKICRTINLTLTYWTIHYCARFSSLKLKICGAIKYVNFFPNQYIGSSFKTKVQLILQAKSYILHNFNCD